MKDVSELWKSRLFFPSGTEWVDTENNDIRHSTVLTLDSIIFTFVSVTSIWSLESSRENRNYLEKWKLYLLPARLGWWMKTFVRGDHFLFVCLFGRWVSRGQLCHVFWRAQGDLKHKVTTCPSLSGKVPIYTCCPWKIINSAPFSSQNCPCLSGELYDHSVRHR